MKILVTGANGFVGRSLSSKIISNGFSVRGLSRKNIDRHNITENIIFSGFDEKTDFLKIVGGCKTVVHLAARVHMISDSAVNPLDEFRKINLTASLSLARHAAELGVSRFIFVSSIGVNGAASPIGQPFSETDEENPHNNYSLSKWEAEIGLRRISRETGMDIVIIRPPLVYGFGAPGNFGALMRAVQRGWPLPLGAVHNRRSLVALDNLVDFIDTCITHPQAANQTFLVSDGQDLSTTELVRGMARAARVPARLLPIPVWALQAGADLLGKGDAVQRLCGNLQVDISKSKNLLGWTPPISVEEGLRRAAAGVHKI